MKKLLLILFLAGALPGQAQNDPLYAQYLNNPLVINPAYTGLNNNLNSSLSYRKQWNGFDGGATTANLSAHASLHENKMGLGLLLIQDKIGVNKNTELHGTYAYKLDLRGKYLSFGLQAGIINFKSNNENLNPYDQNDPAFSSNQNFTKFSLGAGIILKSERYFFGLSVPRLLKEQARIGDGQTSLYNQHFYAMAAYVFILSDHVRFKPSALFKAVKGAPLSVDLNTSFILNEKYTVGVYTRNLETYGILAQVRFASAYRFGYTFEIPTNNSVGTRFTTHELCLGLNLSVFSYHNTSVTSF